MTRLLPLLTILICLPSLQAEVVSLEVLKREPFAGGTEFGGVGSYEKIVGIVRYAIDPKHPRNKDIIDLQHAPRNKEGKVEFEADVFILAPKNLSKGNGAILYDVNNRGNKLAVGMFNSGGAGNDPGEGNGFLFRRGYTVVWSGWNGEVLPGAGRMLLKPPVATNDDKPIKGMVRFEIVSDAPAETMPLSRREGHGSYSPTKEGEETGALTWRMRETDERVAIPREQWSLIRMPLSKPEQGVEGTLSQVRMRLAGGFRAGYIYEFICECENPIVQGTGFAAVRDLISYLKHDTSKFNPLLLAGKKSSITRAHGFGVSQSGRFLRHLLYQGFNVDEQGRKVFDGLMPHVAGAGLGFFNHRFAQLTRHNGQHEEHFFPADMFPFNYGDAEDHYSKKTDGILKRLAAENPKLLPKVMHTHSCAEYWHRSGSLVHTDTQGKRDVEIPENVRLYSFGGTQHGPASDPPDRGIGDNLRNPGDYKPFLRALLDALDTWVVDGKAPPASFHPKIEEKTLVPWRQKDTGFPALPGVRYPEVIQQPSALDYGPDFTTKGILSIHPPKVIGPYPVLVPASDADGNDRGCLLPVEVGVSLATYTGWNLRNREVGAEGMLASLFGSYLPFPKTAEDRKEKGDPRKSIEERYGTYKEYRMRVEEYCRELVAREYLLKEDTERILKALEARWKAATTQLKR